MLKVVKTDDWEFERDKAVESDVLSLVDYTHPATAELFENTVV